MTYFKKKMHLTERMILKFINTKNPKKERITTK